MKRKIALILCAAMITSVVACAKESQGTRTIHDDTKAPQFTSDSSSATKPTDGPSESTTEATTSESTTEAPSETTTEATTSKEETTTVESSTEATTSQEETTSEATTSTEETSESTRATSSGNYLPPKSDFICDTNLETIDFEVFPIRHVYGARNPDDSYSPACVKVYLDGFDIYDDDFEALYNAIDTDIYKYQDKQMTLYEEARKAFIEQQKNEPVALESEVFSFYLYPVRADNQLTSLFYTTNEGSEYREEYVGATYYSMTGEKVEFSDVVTDLDGLVYIVETYVNKNFSGYELADAENLVDKLKAGKAAWAINYNSIILTESYIDIIICVADHPSLFNMKYFGSAPEVFNLLPSSENRNINWDFSGNGSIDTVRVEDDNSEGSVSKIMLCYDGQFSYVTDLSPFEYTYYDSSTVMYDGTNYYLYVMSYGDSNNKFAAVYHITPSSLDYVGVIQNADFTEAFWINPDYFTVNGRSHDVIGSVSYREYYSLIPSDGGMPESIYPYLEGELTVYITKTEMKGKKIDISTGEAIEDVTIPKDTALGFYLLGYGNNAVYFEVLMENEKDNYYVKFDIEKGGDYGYTIQGKSADDIFYHVQHSS